MHLPMAMPRGEQDEATAALARYEPFIKTLANRYAGPAAEFEDLAQVARLATLRAIADHDPQMDGGKGLDGLVWLYIQRAIWNHLRDQNGLIKVPSNKVKFHRVFMTSIHRPLVEGSDQSIEDVIAAKDEDQLMPDEERKLIRQALRRLPIKEREILQELFMQGVKPTDIARSRGCTRTRVYQLRDRGLQLLRGFPIVQHIYQGGIQG